MPLLEPVTVEVKEALVGPVAGGDEEDEEKDRAVDARAIEEVGEEEEGDDESRKGDRSAILWSIVDPNSSE